MGPGEGMDSGSQAVFVVNYELTGIAFFLNLQFIFVMKYDIVNLEIIFKRQVI